MLRKIKSNVFNNVNLDFYTNDNDKIFLIREQLGKALGYIYPNETIEKIHKRYSSRLEKYVCICNINGINTYLYSIDGVLKICCWSRVKKADYLMEWLLQQFYINYLVESLDIKDDSTIITGNYCEMEYYTMKQVSNILFNGVGRNKLFSFLRDLKILDVDNNPYKKYINCGYFIVKEKHINVTVKKINIRQTFVSHKGLEYIKNLCDKYDFKI